MPYTTYMYIRWQGLKLVCVHTSVFILMVHQFLGPKSTFWKTRSDCFYVFARKLTKNSIFDRFRPFTGLDRLFRKSRKIDSRKSVEFDFSENENKTLVRTGNFRNDRNRMACDHQSCKCNNNERFVMTWVPISDFCGGKDKSKPTSLTA